MQLTTPPVVPQRPQRRRYGRARRGARVVDNVPHDHGKTTTVIAACAMMA
ncbi:MAG TPA: hypothetical protein VHK45_05015 [Geminicoccaceae bacterium]|nr:hypothetical protein [Geminicoccaceae bacterium]